MFLFDALIVLCKPNLRRASVSGPQGEFKLKEKFNVRKITVRDREDCEGKYHKVKIHYANMSVQYTAIFHDCKNDNFQMKNILIFFLFLLKT